MAERRPLVVISGEVKELPSEDTLPGGGGSGLPAGGTTGQLLAKASGTNYDTEWIDPPTGGGSPVNVIETADFQLDPAGDHPDRCVIVLTGSNSSSSFPWIKLPALVDQPAAGYTVTAVLTNATNSIIGVTSNDTLFWVDGYKRLEISYVGDDFWLIDPGDVAPEHLLNADP